jgi:hypothetical protein
VMAVGFNDCAPFTFSRERNRVHARNTRERKRAQMDLLQQRIQELADEVSFHFTPTEGALG